MRKTGKAPAKTAAKTAAKVTVAAAEEVKAAEAKAETAAEPVKAEKAKTAVEEAPKAEEKKAPARTSAKKAVTETIYLQYLGKEINKDDLMKQVKEIWTKELKHKVGDMKTVALYLKPEENKAYYVINEEVTGSIAL